MWQTNTPVASVQYKLNIDVEEHFFVHQVYETFYAYSDNP